MKTVHGMELGDELMKALGLDGAVASININADCCGMAVVTVKKYITDEELGGLRDIFEQYKLVEKEVVKGTNT